MCMIITWRTFDLSLSPFSRLLKKRHPTACFQGLYIGCFGYSKSYTPSKNEDTFTGVKWVGGWVGGFFINWKSGSHVKMSKVTSFLSNRHQQSHFVTMFTIMTKTKTTLIDILNCEIYVPAMVGIRGFIVCFGQLTANYWSVLHAICQLNQHYSIRRKNLKAESQKTAR